MALFFFSSVYQIIYAADNKRRYFRDGSAESYANAPTLNVSGKKSGEQKNTGGDPYKLLADLGDRVFMDLAYGREIAADDGGERDRGER